MIDEYVRNRYFTRLYEIQVALFNLVIDIFGEEESWEGGYYELIFLDIYNPISELINRGQ